MSIPNILTLFRIALIPVFVVVFYLPFKWCYMTSALIFAVACLTDLFDGYLARRLNQTSALGAFLDPVADKLLVAVALVLLVGEHATAWLSAPAAVIVCREIVISALREWMAELGKRSKIAVGFWGKIKTTAQMVAIVILLSQPAKPFSNPWVILGYILLYIASLLTLWSMFGYLRAAWDDLVMGQDRAA